MVVDPACRLSGKRGRVSGLSFWLHHVPLCVCACLPGSSIARVGPEDTIPSSSVRAACVEAVRLAIHFQNLLGTGRNLFRGGGLGGAENQSHTQHVRRAIRARGRSFTCPWITAAMVAGLQCSVSESCLFKLDYLQCCTRALLLCLLTRQLSLCKAVSRRRAHLPLKPHGPFKV